MWSSLSLLHARALTFLFLTKVRLSSNLTLPSHDLMVWTNGLCLLFLWQRGSDVLANCFLCGAEATLSFSAGPVCSIISPEACAILQAFRWFRQNHQVCLRSFLLFSDSRFVFASLSFLSHTLWFVLQELSFLSSSFTIRLRWVPGHPFSLGNDTADELARKGAVLQPPVSSHVVSSHHLYPLFSRAVGLLYHFNSSTHRSLRNLCFFVTLVFSWSSLKRTPPSV